MLSIRKNIFTISEAFFNLFLGVFMKKNFMKISMIFAMIVFGSQAFAEINFALHIGPGFGNYIYDNSSSNINETALGFTALKITDSNLALKWHAEFDMVHGDQMFQKVGKANGGWFTFGLGKTISKNEKMTLTLMPVLGLGFVDCEYEVDSTTVSGEQDKYHSTVFAFRMGADFTGIFRLTKVVGVFTNLGLYYDAGSLDTKVEVKTNYGETSSKNNYSLNGWTFAPAIGVNLTFGN